MCWICIYKDIICSGLGTIILRLYLNNYLKIPTILEKYPLGVVMKSVSNNFIFSCDKAAPSVDKRFIIIFFYAFLFKIPISAKIWYDAELSKFDYFLHYETDIAKNRLHYTLLPMSFGLFLLWLKKLIFAMRMKIV